MRRRQVELEQAVIAAVRNWLIEITVPWAAHVSGAASERALIDAIKALNECEAAELTGAGARWVEGSPETSRGAAALAVPAQRSARHHIIAALAHPPRMWLPGLTDEQLERVLGKPHQTVSSARNWLVESGWVIDSGQRRKTLTSRRMAVVWMLSPAGLEKLRGES